MLNTTTVTFAGNLAADPELRFTTTGKPVAELRVIVNRRVRDDDGDYTDAEPTAWTCTTWETLAENVTASLTKGDRVLVAGRIETDTWTDRDTGDKRTKPLIHVDAIGPDLTWATAQPTRTSTPQTTPPTTEVATGPGEGTTQL